MCDPGAGLLSRPTGNGALSGRRTVLRLVQRTIVDRGAAAFLEEVDQAGRQRGCRGEGEQPGDHAAGLLLDDAEAERCHVDASLIVIGLRHRTQVGKFILGSHAQQILMRADRPVLAVKADGGR
ncbi:universal stress protein [Arthrobacter liuii]|uniref:universal stress protein n=1 Tax=Arthrobacter liuii TaxID=1476996 RepID=UPI003570D7A9